MDTNELSAKRPKKVSTPLPETITFAELDEESQDVFNHFGVQAAGLLNIYSVALEDALIEQVTNVAKARKETIRLRALLEEHNISH